MSRKSFKSMVWGTAIALVLGLSLDMARRGAEGHEPDTAGPATAATFYQPRIDGLSIDVRMMAHMRASPTQTAERFCRDKGYTTVADLVTRPSAATRTIADGAVHAALSEMKQAFAMIRCDSHHRQVAANG